MVLRMPTTPVASGSGQMSMPPAGFAVQSGSLITPQVSKRVARGVSTTFLKPIVIRFAGSGWFARNVKNFSPP